MTTQAHSTFEWIDLNSLSVDPRVQRPEDRVRVAHIASTFNPMSLGTVTVSRRPDSTMVVLDGQTRCAAARKVGYAGPIHAQVFTGLTIEQEATAFLDNNDSKPVSALDKFMVRVTQKDAVAVSINETARQYGYTIRPSGGAPGTIQAVGALETLYRKGEIGGRPLLESVLAVIRSAYGDEYSAVGPAMLSGLGEFLRRYFADADMERLTRVLSLNPPRRLHGTAKARKDALGGSISVQMGQVIREAYNAGARKRKLAPWT